MRAINLIPAEERRGGSAAGRSGGLVYVVLGTLGLLAALAAMYGVATKANRDKQAELADVTARAAAAERAAHALAGYTDFAAVRRQRAQAVKTIAEGRVDWAHVLHEVARTVPSDAWLTSLHAKSGAAATGAANPTPAGGTTPSAAAGSATGAAPAAPLIDLDGCTTGQSAVSKLMAELRRIDGVAKVQLTSSAKGTAAGSAGASSSSASTSGASGGPCSKPGRATFAMTLSFRAPAAPAAAAPATATAGSTP
jgi:Tfp pilus assembly protein PilN